MNVEEENFSGDLHQFSHYENSDVTQNPDKNTEEGRYVKKDEQVEENERKENTFYESLQENPQEPVTEYEQIKLNHIKVHRQVKDSQNVYESLQHHQEKHPYADLTAM